MIFIIASVILQLYTWEQMSFVSLDYPLIFWIEIVGFTEKIRKSVQSYILQSLKDLLSSLTINGLMKLKCLIEYVFLYQISFKIVQKINLIHTMILIILSLVVVVALIAVAFLKIKQKIIILGACVISLVIANLINQIYIINDYPSSAILSQSNQLREIQKLSTLHLNSIDNDTFHKYFSELLEEQKEVMNMVVRYWSDSTYPLLHFDSLHPERLRLILSMVNHKVNSTEKGKQLLLYHLNYFEHQCDQSCFAKTFKKNAEDHFHIVIVQNIQKIEDMSIIQESYMELNFAVIFQNLPRNFRMHSISDLTYRHIFSDNYLPKILEQHPAKTIEYCSNYRTFDYTFYSASLTTPLVELCSGPLPWTQVTSCLSKHLNDPKDKIPEGWAKECLKYGNLQGVIFENGWVKLKKQYYWGAKLKNETASDSVEQV